MQEVLLGEGSPSVGSFVAEFMAYVHSVVQYRRLKRIIRERLQ